jgi:hypothetical protein
MRCIAKQHWATWISLQGITLRVGSPEFWGMLMDMLTDGKEVNMANNAQAYRAGQHPGYEETAWEGLQQTVDVIARKGIFVVINGGALNPRGLAEKVEALVCHPISASS